MSEEGREAEDGERESGPLDRVRGFSDGVFAVAITLLVLTIEVPRGSGEPLSEVLADLGPDVISYFVAFLVIGMFWYGHHLAWDAVTRATPSLVWANTVFLAFVVLIPFTTSLIGEYSEPVAFAIYAGNIAIAALLDVMVDRIALREGVVAAGARHDARAEVAAGSARASIFLASIPLAWIDVTLAQLSWLLLIVLPPAASRWATARQAGSRPGRSTPRG